MEKYKQSLKEEIANSATHGIGFLLSIAGFLVLVVSASLHGDTWRVVSFSIYGGCLIALYAASTLYHSFSLARLKYIFKKIDHSTIYLLIAGSYTPFILVLLRGKLGWTFLGAIWGLTLAGIIFQMFFVDRFVVLSTVSYLIMGWLALVILYPIVKNIPYGAISWLVAGGMFYSLGIFHFFIKFPFHHTIWHLFVLGGSMCHYFAILFYVLPV
ncbi:MAG: hemolysin III family protein [Candidatus Omnitrophota bacterium]|nr:hemolysin III family protein [Candidatus Omnitrophota bacterium]